MNHITIVQMNLCLPQHSALFNLFSNLLCSSVLPFCSSSQHQSTVPLFSFLACFIRSILLYIPSTETGILFLLSQHCSTILHLSLSIIYFTASLSSPTFSITQILYIYIITTVSSFSSIYLHFSHRFTFHSKKQFPITWFLIESFHRTVISSVCILRISYYKHYGTQPPLYHTPDHRGPLDGALTEGKTFFWHNFKTYKWAVLEHPYEGRWIGEQVWADQRF